MHTVCNNGPMLMILKIIMWLTISITSNLHFLAYQYPFVCHERSVSISAALRHINLQRWRVVGNVWEI